MKRRHFFYCKVHRRPHGADRGRNILTPALAHVGSHRAPLSGLPRPSDRAYPEGTRERTVMSNTEINLWKTRVEKATVRILHPNRRPSR
jgi:hypothetical protein